MLLRNLLIQLGQKLVLVRWSRPQPVLEDECRDAVFGQPAGDRPTLYVHLKHREAAARNHDNRCARSLVHGRKNRGECWLRYVPDDTKPKINLVPHLC